MFQFSQKLLHAKSKLKEWNQENFKNIFKEKAQVKEELSNLNVRIIKRGMRQEEFELEQKLKSELTKMMNREELYWR